MSVGIKNIQSPQRQVFAVAVTKTGLGTPVLSGLCAKFCSIVDNGVGDYTIIVNAPRPSAQKLIATVQNHTSGIINIVQAGSTKLQVQLNCFAVNGSTPAELDFDIVIYGSYASDLMG